MQRHPARARIRQWLAAIVLAVVIAMTASVVTTERVSAVPPGITFSRIWPTAGDTLFVARTAANNPLNPPTFQLKAHIFLNNANSVPSVVTNVTISYPGTSIAPWSYTPVRWGDFDEDTSTPNTSLPFVLEASSASGPEETAVPVYDGLQDGRDLPTPLPATVRFDIRVDRDRTPITLHYDLAFRDNAVPLRAHFFPARASDLEDGEYWSWGTRHTVDAGGAPGNINPATFNSQAYGLDLGVVAWNGTSWTNREGNGSANSHFLVWEKALYSMGDGTIVACYRGEPDRAPGTDKHPTSYGAGNSLRIRYGNDRVEYAHIRNGTIPQALCPSPSSPGPGLYPDPNVQSVNIPVTAGQFLGRVGNTGRSSGPHLHLDIVDVSDIAPNTIQDSPIQFLNIRARGDEDSINNLGANPVLRPLHGKTLHRNSLILPNPCGWKPPPAGAPEVSVHGVAARCYQDVYNAITFRGYRPVFVDGYDVGGNTFFNATFRPAGPASAARHGLTGPEYQDLFEDLTDRGYRLHQVDSYLAGGQVRYAAIFEKRPGPKFAAFHGLDDAEYAAAVDDLAEKSYVPVNVSTVEVGRNRYWTGLFEKVPPAGWTLDTVPAADYQDLFDANTEAGRVPIYVHGFNTAAGPYLTGIFVDPVGASWAAVHDRSSDGYQAAYNANTDAGRFTRYTTGYDNGAGQAKFAAVWRRRPITSFINTPPAITKSRKATFTFSADNPFTTFECRLDGAPFSPCTKPVKLTGLTEGSHVFRVRAVDRERLVDLTPVSHTWLVDVTPPEVRIVEPVRGTKTVNGVVTKHNLERTSVVGWARVAAGVTDDLSGTASVRFEVNDVPMPPRLVDRGRRWSFRFEPHLRGWQNYRIEVIGTDRAENTTSSSIWVRGKNS